MEGKPGGQPGRSESYVTLAATDRRGKSDGAKPRDEVECALVIQMACTHTAAMTVLGIVGGGHGRNRNVAMKASAASRLLRTYASQVEALRRLRNCGSQFVRVEH